MTEIALEAPGWHQSDMEPRSAPARKFDAIESLRGYMAWWVVLGHSLFFIDGGKWLVGYRLSIWLAQGDLAVQVFMIISGFVIAHLLLVRNDDYISYITRRWFRLFPLFVAMLLLAIVTRDMYAVAFVDNPWAQGSEMRAARLASEPAYVWPHLLLRASMLHGLLPDSILPYSGTAFLSPAWSLSLEWQFYLLAPLIVLGMSRPRWAWVNVALVAASAVALSGALGSWQLPSFLPLVLPFFFVGITSRLWFGGNVAILSTALTAASVATYVVLHGDAFRLIIVIAIWSVFLLIAAREIGQITLRSRALDRLLWLLALNPLAVAFGRVSYSTYLCHIPIMALIVGGGQTFFNVRSLEAVGLLTVISLPIVVGASFLFYRWVEQPGIKLGARWARRSKVDELAAA